MSKKRNKNRGAGIADHNDQLGENKTEFAKEFETTNQKATKKMNKQNKSAAEYNSESSNQNR